MKSIACATAIALIALPASANTVADAFEFLCDRTIHFFDDGVGNQIEYTAADGAAYLWFNGQEEVILGTWEVLETDAGRVDICYQYVPGSFGFPDGGRYCHEYNAWVATIQLEGIRDGDRFGLASGTVPFVLDAFPRVKPEAFDAEFPDGPRGAGCVAFVS